MTRFAVIKTDNTAPLIAALKDDCDALKTKGHARADTKVALRPTAQRNAMRRVIRHPWLFGNPIVKSAYLSVYLRKISRQYAVLYAQLAADASRSALIFNGFLAPNALLDLAAQELGMNRLYVENGFFPGTLQADLSGINGFSTLPRDAAFYDALSAEDTGVQWPQNFEVRRSKLAKKTDNPLPDRFIFVPFQVPSDMQILALSPWIADMMALYGEVEKLARSFPHQHFVVKEHPSFPRSIRNKVAQHANIHFANHAVTRDLLEACDGVITVNSTVGLEALVSGKKVITLGNAHYAIDGLVKRAENSAALHAAIADLPGWQPNVRRRETFIKFIYNRFLIPGDRKMPTDETVVALKVRAAGKDTYSQLIGERHHVAYSH